MEKKPVISILCASPDSNYRDIPDLDIYDINRDMNTYTGSNPVIAHPVCAQWSKLRAFAHNKPHEKILANKCYDIVKQNGGIFEHPKGSLVWKEFDWAGFTLKTVYQNYWGFPAEKATILAFRFCTPIEVDLKDFVFPSIRVDHMNGMDGSREKTTLSFNQYLVDCIYQTFKK